MNETFTADLDVYVKAIYDKLYIALKIGDLAEIAISISLVVKVPDEFLDQYGLTKDIGFVLTVNGTNGKMSYRYKGLLVEPICHYIQPDNCRKVSMLTILQEAVAQDTNKPDIQKLEVSEG